MFRVIDDIFYRIAQAPENLEFTIRASYLEIYLDFQLDFQLDYF